MPRPPNVVWPPTSLVGHQNPIKLSKGKMLTHVHSTPLELKNTFLVG